MNTEQLRDYCLRKKAVTEDMPFGDDTLVFRVMDKIFLLLNLEGALSINLKCDPEKAIQLREEYSSIIPGYHMNKKYWNTIFLDGSVPDALLLEMIDHSYDEVIKGLSGKDRGELGKIKE